MSKIYLTDSKFWNWPGWQVVKWIAAGVIVFVVNIAVVLGIILFIKK